jgi:hypothetical protein
MEPREYLIGFHAPTSNKTLGCGIGQSGESEGLGESLRRKVFKDISHDQESLVHKCFATWEMRRECVNLRTVGFGCDGLEAQEFRLHDTSQSS